MYMRKATRPTTARATTAATMTHSNAMRAERASIPLPNTPMAAPTAL